MKKLLATLIALTILSISLVACGGSKIEYAYEGPIEGWADIALPDDAVWSRTVISGPVENHHYEVIATASDCFAFIEMAMEANGWVLSSASSKGRHFIKDGNNADYTVSSQGEGAPLKVLVIIEPAGAYGESDVEETSTESTE